MSPGLGTTSHALGYSHDDSGRITTVTYPDANEAACVHQNGHLASLMATVGGVSKTVVSAPTWRGGDRLLASWSAGNGFTNTCSYDGNWRLTGIAVPGIQGSRFGYGAASRTSRHRARLVPGCVPLDMRGKGQRKLNDANYARPRILRRYRPCGRISMASPYEKKR